MRIVIAVLVGLMLAASAPVQAQKTFEKDVIKTKGGDLEITFIGHGTLMLRYQGRVIHVDPWSRAADYSTMPKADLILVTHQHGDHLDTGAVAALRTKETVVVLTKASAAAVKAPVVMQNGDRRELAGVTVTAVPAYNIAHKRENGEPFHPKGEGNGYVIAFGEVRLYVAGDTENTPEMKELKDIDVAFLPMNLPYTMTPEMVADAAKSFRPRILYPYHTGSTDVAKLVELLKDLPAVEVRLRAMK